VPEDYTVARFFAGPFFDLVHMWLLFSAALASGKQAERSHDAACSRRVVFGAGRDTAFRNADISQGTSQRFCPCNLRASHLLSVPGNQIC